MYRDAIQCAVYSVCYAQCAVCTVCAMCRVWCVPFVPCTVYRVCYAQYAVYHVCYVQLGAYRVCYAQCAVYSVCYRQSAVYCMCTMCSSLSAMCRVLCVCCVLSTMCRVLCVYFVQCAIHNVPCTVCVLCAVCYPQCAVYCVCAHRTQCEACVRRAHPVCSVLPSGRPVPPEDRKPLVFKDKKEAIESFKDFLKEKVTCCFCLINYIFYMYSIKNMLFSYNSAVLLLTLLYPLYNNVVIVFIDVSICICDYVYTSIVDILLVCTRDVLAC